MKKVGYARVSTAGQALNAQLDQLGEFGCELTFSEKESGSKSDRPELQRALAALGEGDVLIVTRLDRLARSTRDLLEIVHHLETVGATLKSISDAWADTTTPTGRLILTVLGGLAEFERSLIAERTAEGRARAKAEGRRLGRKPKLTKHQRAEVLRMRNQGISNAEIGRIMGVSRSTVSRTQRA
ncbi:recombinase family protein [Phycobacter azelaicus]|uniref:recombinase family protein n=1 Tax=Phycobacter azelaicus TaxID=2668075 RepID=UPI001866C5FD|nr:recombinase family protein [Phycobacter azelaicus]